MSTPDASWTREVAHFVHVVRTLPVPFAISLAMHRVALGRIAACDWGLASKRLETVSMAKWGEGLLPDLGASRSSDLGPAAEPLSLYQTRRLKHF